MKKHISAKNIAALLAILMMAAALPLSALGVFADDGGGEPAAPKLTQGAAVLYCLNTGQVLYSENEDEILQPYSMTKLMTAYIVVHSMDLSDTTTVSKRACRQEGTSMFLKEGEVISIEELLYGMLMESGNDAAVALAEACAGSVSDFAALMNAAAADLGCTNTHFVNSNGWQNKKHYTTASDFLLIAKQTLADPTVFKIATTKEHEIPSTNKSEARELKAHATLMFDKDSGVLGGKTGFWEDWDCSCSLYYEKNDLRMILVLIGETAKGREKDAKAILRYAEKTIPTYRTLEKDMSLGRIWLKNGSHTRVEIFAGEDAYAYPASGDSDDVSLELKLKDGLSAPLKAGDEIGTAELTVNGEVQSSSPVIVKSDVSRGWLPSRYYISDMATVCGAVAAAVLLLIVFAVRRIRASAASGSDRNYRPRH